jgi:hypothetical protein
LRSFYIYIGFETLNVFGKSKECTVHLSLLNFLLKVGEGRACWSLGNAHSAMGDPEKAYHYAARHLQISKETGDRMGQATAQVKKTISLVLSGRIISVADPVSGILCFF